MEKIKSYKELRVYQTAIETAMLIFDLTKHFPPEEKYSMVDRCVARLALFAPISLKLGASGVIPHISSAS
jgi:hypothetical protein